MNWQYELPTFKCTIVSLAFSLDGTCMHLSQDGWREAMAGTISFYNAQGERQHTIYLGATPEYGKADFRRRFTLEIERAKACYPHAHTIGLADGAESNWLFLKQHTQTAILDFFHASSYLGAVAKAMFPTRPKDEKAWLDERCHQLKHHDGAAQSWYEEMLNIQQSRQTLPHLQEKLDAAVTYFKNHRHQMNYALYNRLHYPVGSGVTEVACKTLVKQRFCQSGMRWKQVGAAAILNLHALV
jgi:hypothetical protein